MNEKKFLFVVILLLSIMAMFPVIKNTISAKSNNHYKLLSDMYYENQDVAYFTCSDIDNKLKGNILIRSIYYIDFIKKYIKDNNKYEKDIEKDIKNYLLNLDENQDENLEFYYMCAFLEKNYLGKIINKEKYIEILNRSMSGDTFYFGKYDDSDLLGTYYALKIMTLCDYKTDNINQVKNKMISLCNNDNNFNIDFDNHIVETSDSFLILQNLIMLENICNLDITKLIENRKGWVIEGLEYIQDYKQKDGLSLLYYINFLREIVQIAEYLNISIDYSSINNVLDSINIYEFIRNTYMSDILMTENILYLCNIVDYHISNEVKNFLKLNYKYHYYDKSYYMDIEQLYFLKNAADILEFDYSENKMKNLINRFNVQELQLNDAYYIYNLKDSFGLIDDKFKKDMRLNLDNFIVQEDIPYKDLYYYLFLCNKVNLNSILNEYKTNLLGVDFNSLELEQDIYYIINIYDILDLEYDNSMAYIKIKSFYDKDRHGFIPIHEDKYRVANINSTYRCLESLKMIDMLDINEFQEVNLLLEDLEGEHGGYFLYIDPSLDQYSENFTSETFYYGLKIREMMQ